MRVVCAGHVNWDVTFHVDRLPGPDEEAHVHERAATGGGSAANAAVAFAGLSCEPRLLGSVGDDDCGERALAELEAAGVDTRVRVVEGSETTTKYVLVEESGEVAVLGTDGANEALGPEDASPELLDGADALHLTSQRPDTAERLAELAADAGVFVSFDPGRRLADCDYGAVLDRSDLLFVTDTEAAQIDAEGIPQVTKRGIDGAVLRCPAGTFEHPGYDLPSVDSTGAGDAFAAGFLTVWLDDDSPERALAVANACGAIAASERGPKPDLSWERIEAVMA
ncbi:carbohydrate kinase family protein [Natronomonas gomsonensis]|uniref:carbohydrate kinase family protein n=1 Tax=Natronomonas gomsonensis TaxID=1046043 RepID=UPI0015BA6B8F|nr:carbohydrate kinase family protein [Natronomonas gomsonensis]